MDPVDLDDVDRGILHMLQEDARNNTASTIAEEVGVSPNTVRNRIEHLEEAGVIQGYNPHLDYETAGFQLRVNFVCTVPVSKRQQLADEALDIKGVVAVSEILSGYENLIVEGVADASDELTSIGIELEEMGITIQQERFFKNTRVQPFDHFGRDVIEDG